MKLIMATSADGFVARNETDDMKWTGKIDKFIFQLLTCCSGGNIGAGSKTFDLMKEKRLPGRDIHRLSTGPMGMPLHRFFTVYPQGWLIGGQTIALEALTEHLLHEVYIVRTPFFILGGIEDEISTKLKDEKLWIKIPFFVNNDPNPSIHVDFYRRKDLWGHTY